MRPSQRQPGPLALRGAIMAIVLTITATGCVQDAEDRATAESALDEASITTQVQSLSASFIEMAATAPSGTATQTRADELASAVSKLLDCGTTSTVTCAASESCCNAHEGTGCDDEACQALVCAAQPACCDTVWSDGCASAGLDLCDGTVVRIQMDEAGCDLRGRQVWGSVTIDVGGEPEAATVEWHDLTDGGVTLTSTATATWSGDGREVINTGTVGINADNDGLYRFRDTRTQTTTAAGVRVVTGTRCSALDADDVDCWTSQGATACAEAQADCTIVESVDTELTWTNPTPLEGDHQVTLMSTGLNRQVDLTYTHSAAPSVQVSAEVRGSGHTLPRSTFVFEVIAP